VRGAVLALLLALATATAHADDAPAPPSLPPVEVHARAEPDTVTIGTRFRYVVEVVTRANPETLVTQPSERIGDFDIVDFGIEPPVRRDDRTVVTRWYTLVGWSPGEHLVKSPPVRYRLPGEELQEAPAAEIRVSVESVLSQSPQPADIRDIKAPEAVPTDWRPYYLLGGSLALVAALAFVLHRVLDRSRRARPGPPPRPPHEIALADLERLRARGLIAEGAFKEYYSTLSTIVRAYLEHRFRVRAPEMTTEEFLLTSARDGRLQAAHRQLLGEFLIESDLVKFAKHLPTIADSERAFTAARRFVDETATGPAAPEGERAAG
jgi:hypothetical protein